MFEFSQLRCFVAVAEELHFGRAAERLNMTQPPLSRQVRLLEHHVGTLLLERNSRAVRLTAAGKAFLPEAVHILRLAEEAGDTARRVAAGEQGMLAIGFTSASGYSLLPEVVRRLRARVPGVSLVLKEMVSTAQAEALHAGTIDLGLMRPHPVDGDLESVELAREALLLALPAADAAHWPDAPTLASLHGKPFLMYAAQEAGPFHRMLTERFARAGVVPDVVEHVGQVHTMLALVSAGMGAALIAEGAARLGFEGVVTRPIATEPVAMAGAWRRDNANPVLALFRGEIVPAIQSAHRSSQPLV
jgi:DNA-binding transcriptional LysR family regulator